MNQSQAEVADLFVIGGGVNGCGIARDAAGRGLSVVLAEKADLASGTSSASTKLFHGGLRYLEYFEVRLVREALKEREVLWQMMPHISRPMRFVLPLSREMRFDLSTPSSKLLGAVMPWLKGRRPDWLIRLGLYAYDHMGGRKRLPATERLDLRRADEGALLQARFAKAYEFSDVWVDDARLVVLNARDAAERGARIMTRAEVLSARREDGLWRVETEAVGQRETHLARKLVNAAGPWVAQMLGGIETEMHGQIRLVRGSHIVVPRLTEHEKAYFLQGADGRICFILPYEQDFTLIGTTDAEHGAADDPVFATEAEQRYLLDFVNGYLRAPLSEADIVWSYAGVRPLQDDGQASASAATRDYELRLEAGAAPLLTVFGGKITSYRKLSEAAVSQLWPERAPWTKGAALPGGGFDARDLPQMLGELRAAYPFLPEGEALRLVRAYGTEARDVLGGATRAEELGPRFGGRLSAAEVRWLMAREFARAPEDVLWRRSKLGLRLESAAQDNLAAFMTAEAEAMKGE